MCCYEFLSLQLLEASSSKWCTKRAESRLIKRIDSSVVAMQIFCQLMHWLVLGGQRACDGCALLHLLLMFNHQLPPLYATLYLYLSSVRFFHPSFWGRAVTLMVVALNFNNFEMVRTVVVLLGSILVYVECT